MTHIKTITLAAIALGLVACGSRPALTETARTTSVQHTDSGGEVRHESTQSLEIANDGSRSTESTESTHTTTPPPGS